VSEAKATDLCENDFKPSPAIHVPRDDVAYNPSPFSNTVDSIQIPLTVNMAERYNLDLPDGTLLEGNLGMIEIYKDGRIVYNEEDISGDIKDTCNHDTGEFETIINQQSQNGDQSNEGRELP
jgi:hypothetical protein